MGKPSNRIQSNGRDRALFATIRNISLSYKNHWNESGISQSAIVRDPNQGRTDQLSPPSLTSRRYLLIDKWNGQGTPEKIDMNEGTDGNENGSKHAISPNDGTF